jgi:hypothetical protein
VTVIVHFGDHHVDMMLDTARDHERPRCSKALDAGVQLSHAALA